MIVLARGKSGLHETGWRVIPAKGNLRESAAENKLPMFEQIIIGKGEKVSVRAHRVFGNKDGRVNPIRSKTK